MRWDWKADKSQTPPSLPRVNSITSEKRPTPGCIYKMEEEGSLVRGQHKHKTSFSGFKWSLITGLKLGEWRFREDTMWWNGCQVSAFLLATMECFFKITRRTAWKRYLRHNFRIAWLKLKLFFSRQLSLPYFNSKNSNVIYIINVL